MSDLIISLDVCAALVTVLYLAKLMTSSEEAFFGWGIMTNIEKRSLLNQQVRKR